MTDSPQTPLLSPADRAARVLTIVRRRRRVALAVAAAVVLLGLVWIATRTPLYEAKAEILLQPSDGVATLVNPGTQVSNANAQRDVDTYARLVTSAPVVSAVRRSLGGEVAGIPLAARVSVSGQQDSNLVTIAARDESPRRAAAIASAFADAYRDYRRETVVAQVAAAAEEGRRALAAMANSGADPAAQQALADRVHGLEALGAVQTGGVQVVRHAAVPRSPASPHTLLQAILVAMLAAALGVLAALAAHRLDRRLRGAEEIEEAYGAPVLAALPAGYTAADPGVGDLVTALATDERMADDHRVVLVAEAGRCRAAPVLAEDLAARLALTGRRVVLVEGRASPVRADGGGLAGVLSGECRVTDAIEPVRVSPGGQAYGVLGFGTAEDGAEEEALLARRELAATLATIREGADAVVLAGGGVVPRRTFAPLLDAADGLVLVIAARTATRAEAAAVLRELGPRRPRLVGVVTARESRRRPTPAAARALARIRRPRRAVTQPIA